MTTPSAVSLVDVPVSQCVHSRFNTRKTRSDEDVQRLADRIAKNGFERTRALWAVAVNGHYEVFAGGTRLEATKVAGQETVPVLLHEGLSEEDISRRADVDNENDEYHTPVGKLDEWAEYHRLWKEEGWTQDKIATAKGCDRPEVANKIRLHTSLPAKGRKAVLDGTLDEGHCLAIIGVVLDIQHFSIWLMTEQAQTELVDEVLGIHRGKTSTDPAKNKPTVDVVRKAAARWKAMIAEAVACHEKLGGDGEYGQLFVKRLADGKVRTIADVNAAYRKVADKKARDAELAAEHADAEAKQQRRETERAARIEASTARILHGDARELIQRAPAGFHLLLTDPPYGMDFQSNRRRTTAKKDKLAGDTKAEAVELLAAVVGESYKRMAADSTALVFTCQELHEEFRRVIAEAGFTVKRTLTWAKKNHGTGDLKGSYAPQTEWIIHAVKGSPELRGRPSELLTGVEFYGSDHPTEKPADLLRLLIKTHTDEQQTVVDPFAGSGSTVYAAMEMNRDWFAIEVEDTWHKHVSDAVYARVSADNGEE